MDGGGGAGGGSLLAVGVVVVGPRGRSAVMDPGGGPSSTFLDGVVGADDVGCWLKKEDVSQGAMSH